MKIETFYPDIETSKKLNELFSLSYHGQDWEIVNADDEKVDDFIKYYLEAEETQEKVTIFALLIGSIDLLEKEIEVQDAWSRIRGKIKANLKYHLNTIIYWALIGYGKDKDHLFTMTTYMRGFLNNFMAIDKFEIKGPSIEGIEINGISFPVFLKENQFLKSFSEVINFLAKEANREDIHLELSENLVISIEKEKKHTHFEIWSSMIGCNYLKVKTAEFEKEIKKYKR